jgi:hypothetical protein
VFGALFIHHAVRVTASVGEYSVIKLRFDRKSVSRRKASDLQERG